MKDRIERAITVKAPIDRVWTALTDHREFGTWFRVRLQGPFLLGQVTRGEISEPGYEGWPFWAVPVTMEAPHLFAFDWPAEVDVTPEMRGPGRSTRVEFRLQAVEGGTRITISESGFAALPPDKALAKFRDNEGGWAIQADRIGAHVGG